MTSSNDAVLVRVKGPKTQPSIQSMYRMELRGTHTMGPIGAVCNFQLTGVKLGLGIGETVREVGIRRCIGIF